MNARTATRYLFWCGEKAEAGDALTPEELIMFNEARAKSKATAKKFLRLNEGDWAYTPGIPFK